ncbi:unnamed protein product [Boreogadus saida]
MGPKIISQSKARRGRSKGAREPSTSSPSPRGPSPAASPTPPSPPPPSPPPASPPSSESEQPEATHKADVPTIKRRREKPVYLTDDQQQLLADWLKDHPEIYTKGCRDFKNTERKKRRWEDMAKDLGVTYEELIRWYQSTRTRVGKLLHTVSGQEVDMSKTDRYLVATFRFLLDHIVRQPTRVAHSLKEKIAASQPSATVSRAPRSSDGSSDEGHMSEPMDTLTQPEPEGDTGGPSTSTDRSTKGKGKGKGKTTQPAGFLDLVAQLQEQQDANESLQRQVRSVLEPPVNISTSSMFGSFMASMVETRVRSNLQPQLYQECFALLMNFVDQSAQVTTPVPQPITQPMPQTSFHPMQNLFNLDPRFGAQQERRGRHRRRRRRGRGISEDEGEVEPLLEGLDGGTPREGKVEGGPLLEGVEGGTPLEVKAEGGPLLEGSEGGTPLEVKAGFRNRTGLGDRRQRLVAGRQRLVAGRQRLGAGGRGW